jgi:hypothetical protein
MPTLRARVGRRVASITWVVVVVVVAPAAVGVAVEVVGVVVEVVWVVVCVVCVCTCTFCSPSLCCPLLPSVLLCSVWRGIGAGMHA